MKRQSHITGFYLETLMLIVVFIAISVVIAIIQYRGGITFIDSTGYIVEDLNAKKIISSNKKGANKEEILSLPHAYLQYAINNFAEQ